MWIIWLWGLLVLLSLGFYVSWLVALRRAFLLGERQAAGGDEMQAESALSLVVCARNERRNMSRLLHLLRRQRLREVVVVDDASEDGTRELLERAARRWRRLRIVRIERKELAGKKAALAAGVAAAAGDWLLVCDADCRPASRHWARDMWAAAQEKGGAQVDFVLGFSPYRDGGGLLGAWVCFEAMFTLLQYGGMAMRGEPYMGVGRNMLYRKSAFERYDWRQHADLASGDDDLLVNAQARGSRTRLCLKPSAWVYTLPPRTWGAYLRQKRQHFSASSRYQWRHKIALGLFVQSHVWSWWLLPLALYMSPLYALAFWLLRCVVVDLGLYWLAKKTQQERLGKFILLFDIGIAAYFTIFAFILALTKQQGRQWK